VIEVNSGGLVDNQGNRLGVDKGEYVSKVMAEI
jgi:hypothetical protein